jgi:hypothetical protein
VFGSPTQVESVIPSNAFVISVPDANWSGSTLIRAECADTEIQLAAHRAANFQIVFILSFPFCF